ncbi:cob(I)yrinic acid a,c-diamide adenosyltransferase [Bacteroidales bacterium OttesenSCG-928-M11]|nr:cob(I)yrinic acid a,c-diamide adenosyltransferase [Bacteroidales bacterium OttesenSCG-928-M11]
MAKSKIYTRKGDEGYTSLVSGNRVYKSNIRIEAYGTIDELNSFIAVLRNDVNDPEDRKYLSQIQSNLFVIGGYLANDLETNSCQIKQEEVSILEQEIDKIDNLLPPLKHFILPGGGKGSADAHVCRTVCRRAERCIYLLKERSEVDSVVLEYINRLSDYFFLFSRKMNFIENIEEIVWENTCK